MNQEIEIEFKNILTEQEFNEITSAFKMKTDDFIQQENHYFDTENFQLKSKQSALRIRYKKGKYTLTLKQPHEEGLLETHQPLTVEDATKMIENKGFIEGDVATLLRESNIEPTLVAYLGSLKTNRAEVSYKNGTLVFDHSMYLGTEDFELEYEVSNYEEGDRFFKQLLHEHSIPTRNTPNKIRRFFHKKKNS